MALGASSTVKVSASVVYVSMSLGGYIAGPNDDPGNPDDDGFNRLHEWLAPGEREIVRPAGPARRLFDEWLALSAVVAQPERFLYQVVAYIYFRGHGIQGFQLKSIHGILTHSIRGVRGRPPQESEMNFTRPRHAVNGVSRPDEALCREVAAGSQEAFLILFDRHWQQVFRIAYSILRDEAEAEDLAQALFLEVHRTLLRFDERKGSFRTLLLRYAYTRSIDHRRHLQSRRFYSSVEYEDLGVTVLIQEPLLMSGLSLEECRRLIEQVLTHLDSKQRATVEAYFFRG